MTLNGLDLNLKAFFCLLTPSYTYKNPIFFLTLPKAFLKSSAQIPKSELRPSRPTLSYKAVSRLLPVDTPIHRIPECGTTF
jgi:hypothetical protein